MSHRLSAPHALLAVLVATIWGVNFVVIEWGMGDVPPLIFVALRFTAVVLPAVFLVPRPDAPWRSVVGVGLFMSLGQFGLLYTSMHAGMPPGLAALVLQAQVLFTVLIAATALHERPTARQLAGILVGAAGLVVVGAGRGGHVPLGALLLCLAAALSWGIGNVISRSASAARPGNATGSGLSMAVWSSLVVPVPLVLLSLVLDGPGAVAGAVDAFGWHALLSTIYTAGLASLVGYSIFNGLLARYPASSVVPFVLIAPPVAMASAWLFLDQVPNAAEALGGLVVLAGVLLTVLSGRKAGQGAVQGTRSGGDVERGDEGLDPAADLVPDRAHRLDALAGGVVELPVLVPLAGEEGALVAAAHRDDHVGLLDGFGGEDLRLLGGDVDAELRHRGHGDRVDLVRGLGAGGQDLDPVAGQVAEEARGHLRAPGVVDADEQDGGLAPGGGVGAHAAVSWVASRACRVSRG